MPGPHPVRITAFAFLLDPGAQHSRERGITALPFTLGWRRAGCGSRAAGTTRRPAPRVAAAADSPDAIRGNMLVAGTLGVSGLGPAWANAEPRVAGAHRGLGISLGGALGRSLPVVDLQVARLRLAGYGPLSRAASCVGRRGGRDVVHASYPPGSEDARRCRAGSTRGVWRDNEPTGKHWDAAPGHCATGPARARDRGALVVWLARNPTAPSHRCHARAGIPWCNLAGGCFGVPDPGRGNSVAAVISCPRGTHPPTKRPGLESATWGLRGAPEPVPRVSPACASS
jgi:hypothetical protein